MKENYAIKNLKLLYSLSLNPEYVIHSLFYIEVYNIRIKHRIYFYHFEFYFTNFEF